MPDFYDDVTSSANERPTIGMRLAGAAIAVATATFWWFVGEKVFAELQPLWNDAFGAARAPFEDAQKASIERRQAMIAEAAELGAQPMLRIDAVKALQQRWQAEAQGVPLDRRQEQKMWDAFRAPIDDAFNRKTAEREKASSAMSDHDRYVLNASKARPQPSCNLIVKY
ncbi:hypothetical protein MMC31_007556 [Peltigera leucophlebia]|nr:hypothetical protein [Peltigera leucophlebia]